MNEKIIYKKVLDVYRFCDVKTFPIDCEKILMKYGFALYSYNELRTENPTLYDAVHRFSNDAFRYRMSIYYNSSVNPMRIRFSFMHELGHFLLEHKEDNQKNEDEANYFASCILAPRILIHFLTEKKNADEIHDTFGLSYAASNIALKDYKRWCLDHSNILIDRFDKAELDIYAPFRPKPQKEKVKESTKKKSSELIFKPIPEDIPEDIKKSIKRLRRGRRKIAKQMKEYEEKIRFMQEYDIDILSVIEQQRLYAQEVK